MKQQQSLWLNPQWEEVENKPQIQMENTRVICHKNDLILANVRKKI